jgi:hypothetical protein
MLIIKIALKLFFMDLKAVLLLLISKILPTGINGQQLNIYVGQLSENTTVKLEGRNQYNQWMTMILPVDYRRGNATTDGCLWKGTVRVTVIQNINNWSGMRRRTFYFSLPQIWWTNWYIVDCGLSYQTNANETNIISISPREEGRNFSRDLGLLYIVED